MVKFCSSVGGTTCEACSAKWNLGTNSAFLLELRKPRKIIIDLAGRRASLTQIDF
jgi:hypothetical protein